MSETDREPLDFQDRITVDPKIFVGKPVVKGTRIPVSMNLNMVAHGSSFDQIIDDNPLLTENDIRAALLYTEG